MGVGFWIFRFFGVGADWLWGNLWRRIRGKAFKTFKEIWNGDIAEDYLDNAGYNIFYVILGMITLPIAIYLLSWILNMLFPGQTFF